MLAKIHTGTRVDIDQIKFEVGGSGVNAAITFAKHGHETIFMGNLARDVGGRAVVQRLNQESVDTSYINFLSRQLITDTSVILLDSNSGERTILSCAGAGKYLGNLEPLDLDLIHPDWLYMADLNGDFAVLQSFIKKARELKIKIMLNPSEKDLSAPQELLKILSAIDVLILNKREAAKIVPGKSLTELLYHLGNYASITIITDGPMGGIAKSGDEVYRFGIYADAKIRDTTGAGEAFGAGFLAHFADQKSFQESLIFASANATAVIREIGGNRGTLTGKERLHPMPIQKI